MRKSTIFLDTSVQIARTVHSESIRRQVEERTSGYGQTMTGLVVRLEYKRRLLKEARYLLDQLDYRKSFEKVLRHVHDDLPPIQRRKSRICIQALITVDERDGDADRTERARLFLRNLLRFGLRDFDGGVDKVCDTSRCAAGASEVTEKKPYRSYDFGHDRCDRTKGSCGIGAFLAANREPLKKVLDYLRTLPKAHGKKTDELEAAEKFIEAYLADPTNIEAKNPCSTVGDLLVALESQEAECFYTMNWKESTHLARVMRQDLVYRPPNGDKADVECPIDADWEALLSGKPKAAPVVAPPPATAPPPAPPGTQPPGPA